MNCMHYTHITGGVGTTMYGPTVEQHTKDGIIGMPKNLMNLFDCIGPSPLFSRVMPWILMLQVNWMGVCSGIERKLINQGSILLRGVDGGFDLADFSV